MEKKKVFENDVEIRYECGCKESKLENHEEDDRHCQNHHRWIKTDEWGYNCWCGAYKEA